MENVRFVDEMEELDKRFVLQKSQRKENCWLITDKPNNIIYSFIEKDYFNTLKVEFLNDKQANLSYAEKMDLKYEMEYWFLYMHEDLVYPDNEFTFKPFKNLNEGYYKITHNTPPVFDVIVKSEGCTKQLADYLRQLADICDRKDMIII